jgi:hypothetical protein
MDIYMLDGGNPYMAYKFVDTELQSRLMGATTGYVTLPDICDLPLRMVPGFGDAPNQPTKLGDFHCFMGSRRLFSERAVEALSLSSSGHLFPAELEGRDEKFYWYWSTTIVDCLDNSKTKRLMHSVREPVFFEDRIGDAEVFTTPDDQKFQFHLYVTESFREKIKRAKLKGFVLRRGASDTKPWKS